MSSLSLSLSLSLSINPSSSIKYARYIIMMTRTKPSRLEVARAYAVLKAAKTKHVMIAKTLKKTKLHKKYELYDEEPTTSGYYYYCPSSPSDYVPSMPCYCP